MADGKIYITITDERKAGTTGTIGQADKITDNTISSSKQQSGEQLGAFDVAVISQFTNFIKNEAKKTVNYTLGNIGNFTGDYQTQKEVNFALSVGESLAGIGMSTYQGFKIGGVKGAVVGAVISVAGIAINEGLKHHSENVAVAKQNYEIKQLRQLSGLDTTTNGSR